MPDIPEEVAKLLESFTKESYKINPEQILEERPIYGTTIFLAKCEVEMICGDFTAYIFQDIIHKGYIIALAHGDIQGEKTLYTRIHSSCVTSETLRGCDCDCVEQLQGALNLIAEKGAGILFYLMQEGRGVGYIAKARDRMLVQASDDTISTFEAYKALGLKRDYRQYRNVCPIIKMLDIQADFVLLTNNPTKVEILTEEGLKINRVENLEYEPGPYNLAYLTSKMEEGHILKLPLDSHITRIQVPELVIPFKPRVLPEANRFIYAASYFLPIRPVNDEIVLNAEQFANVFRAKGIEYYIESEKPLIKNFSLIRKNHFKIALHRENFLNHRDCEIGDPVCKLLHLPHWFRVHVYFDTVTNKDYVVLTYGHMNKEDIPVVRIQSESLFNRFPVVDSYNHEKYKASIQEIVNYGAGAVVLLYSDGRGAGLGAFAQDIMFTQAKHTQTTAESYERLGVNYDSRDYASAMSILKAHLPHNKVQMIMNNPTSLVLKNEYPQALKNSGLEVEHWIFLDPEHTENK